jgi:hypothetical protein
MKNKKPNLPDMFDYVQGYTKGYFEYVLANDQVIDNEYIALKYFELLQMFTEFKLEDKFMVAFFSVALDEDVLTGRHLDKLGIALKSFASTTVDQQAIADVDWTMRHLDIVYTKFKESKSK